METVFKKVFVPGGDGFLGKSVVKKLQEENINVVSRSLKDGVDFRNFEQTKALFEKEKFDAVINCAAYVGGIEFGLKHQGEIFYNNILMDAYLLGRMFRSSLDDSNISILYVGHAHVENIVEFFKIYLKAEFIEYPLKKLGKEHSRCFKINLNDFGL